MQKIFNVDEKIIFPLKTIEKQIKNYTIILAPEFPNWIVLDNDEFKLYKELKKNTIKNSLENYKTHFKYDDEKIIVIAQRLLNKVERSKFYENTPIIKEERIENIKKKVQINLTNNCNLRCSHCYLSAGKLDLKSLNFEKIKNTLIELTDVIGISEIVFSGGEPLMYPKLFDLLSFSKRLGHKNILFTNGILITKDTIEILKNSVEEIQLSMEGISKKNYEFIRGKNTYDSFLETLLFLKEQQFPVSLAITAIDSVLDDIENNLVAFIQKINYENLNIRITDELEQSGNAKDFPKEYFELNYDRKTRINKVIYDLKFNGFNIDFNNNRNINNHFCRCGPYKLQF